jgi:hypothetical protein
MLTGGRSGGRARPSEEETGLVQQMHQQLLKMEERIESLETLLFERERDREETRR